MSSSITLCRTTGTFKTPLEAKSHRLTLGKEQWFGFWAVFNGSNDKETMRNLIIHRTLYC
jgi:hypothetical protein